MRVEVAATPGVPRSGSLMLSNGEAQPVRFRTEVLDFFLDWEGQPQFVREAPAEAQFSCRQWLAANPMEAEIPAGGHAQVRYTVRVPTGVPDRSYHCALGFTSLPPARTKQAASIGMVSAVRMICALYVQVGSAAPQGELKEIRVEKVDAANSSGLRAVFSVENSGLVNLRGSGKVEVLTAAGQAVETAEFPGIVILPKRTQAAPLILRNKLTPGAYTVRARVNLGTGEIQEATLGFQVPRAE